MDSQAIRFSLDSLIYFLRYKKCDSCNAKMVQIKIILSKIERKRTKKLFTLHI